MKTEEDIKYLKVDPAIRRLGLQRALLLRIATEADAVRRPTPRAILIDIPKIEAFIDQGGTVEGFLKKNIKRGE